MLKQHSLNFSTRNVHLLRNRMTVLPWEHSWLQSLSVKNLMSPFATFLCGTQGLARNTNGSHIVFTLPNRSLGVDDPSLRNKLRILVLIKTIPLAQLLSWQRNDGCHFVSSVTYISGTKFQEHCFNLFRDILH